MLSDDFFQGKLFSFAGFEFHLIEFGLLSGYGAFEFVNLSFSFLLFSAPQLFIAVPSGVFALLC